MSPVENDTEAASKLPVYNVRELTGAESLALCYTMYRASMIAESAFLEQVKRSGMTQQDFTFAMERGFILLHEKGIVHCERDGHRELYPVKLNLDRLTSNTLILGDKT